VIGREEEKYPRCIACEKWAPIGLDSNPLTVSSSRETLQQGINLNSLLEQTRLECRSYTVQRYKFHSKDVGAAIRLNGVEQGIHARKIKPALCRIALW